MPNAASSFPATGTQLNGSYDPNIGLEVDAMEGFYGGYTGPSSLTGVFAQAMNDFDAISSLTATAGTVFAGLIWLAAGKTVNKLSFITAATPTSTPTNQWAGVASFATTSKVLAISADGLTAVDAADTVLTYSMGTPYPVTAGGLYYYFICFAATTGPTLCAGTTLGAHGRGNVAPFMSGPGATVQTTPPAVGATLTQPTVSAAQAQCYVS